MSDSASIGSEATLQLEAEVTRWRRAREQRLVAPDSWLSLVGKVWLAEGDSSIGSDEACVVVLPADRGPSLLGVARLQTGVVTFTPAAHVNVALRRGAAKQDVAVREPVTLTTDEHGAPDRLVYGSLLLEVMQRGSSFAIRVRDTQSPARAQFAGIDYYPIDPKFRIEARLEPYTPHKAIELAYETGAGETYHAPGAAVFELDGVTHRIDPVFDGERPRLYLIFSDPTSRNETYGAGRFLYAPLPKDNRVLLDFNQAFNPPCAFTPYAFCPLPPTQNRLTVPITAGEKRPRH